MRPSAGRRIGAACQRLEQAHHGRADGDDAAAGRLGRRDPLTRTGRHDEGLAVQALALQRTIGQRLEGAETHVQRDVEDLHAGCTQPLLHLGGEMQPGRGRRRRARVGANTVW